MEAELVDLINKQTGLLLPADTSIGTLRLKLRILINEMITGDFQQLINILYRVDVNEHKLKFLLRENVGEDAAGIIADLIIDRQMEKVISRRKFNTDTSSNDEERW